MKHLSGDMEGHQVLERHEVRTWSKNSTTFHSKRYFLRDPCSVWVPTLAGHLKEDLLLALVEKRNFPNSLETGVGPDSKKMPIPAQPSGSISRSHPSQCKLSGLPRSWEHRWAQVVAGPCGPKVSPGPRREKREKEKGRGNPRPELTSPAPGLPRHPRGKKKKTTKQNKIKYKGSQSESMKVFPCSEKAYSYQKYEQFGC